MSLNARTPNELDRGLSLDMEEINYDVRGSGKAIISYAKNMDSS